jgi:glycosyltransferase involved in cell wall biosynthesis
MARPDRVRVGILVYGLDRPASGIGRYTIELVNTLRSHQPDIEVLLFKPFDHPIPGLEEPTEEIVRLPGLRLLPALMALGPIAIAGLAVRHRIDVVHDPAGVSPFLLPRRVAPFGRVVTIHDVIPFVHPETHATLTNVLFRRYIPRTLRFVDRVVTVSDASKMDVEHFLTVDPRQVTRIHCGVAPRFCPQSPEKVNEVLERHGITQPYVLTVGALQARKNLGVLFDAFAALKAEGMPHRLVVVGNKAWKSEGVFRHLEGSAVAPSVTLTGYVPDADLPALYSGAACFVFPSLYEGFGLPPLEAMACGTPVVVSHASSLPEVVGDAGLLVDPHDAQQIAGAVRRIIETPDLARELRALGVARARRFSWEQAAADHAALYREVASKANSSKRS